MQYAGRLPNVPATRTMLVCVIALLVGAGVATGAYALIDGTENGTDATKYIVVEQQARGSAEIPGKNEAATAVAVSQSNSGIVLRGSKATSSSSAETASENVAPSPTPFSGHY